MPTTLTNGIQLPDKGSVDWYSSMQSNYNLIDTHLGNTDIHVTAEDKAKWDGKQGFLTQDQIDAIAQVATNTNDIATLQSDKADASHTHSSSDITDIDDYATKDYVDNSISGLVDNAPDALNTLNELSAALNDDSNFATTVTNALADKADSADLASVATSGSYTDLTDKPTINDSTITIQKNGSTVDTFTTNGSDKTINIPVPTKTSDLTNDSDFVVSSSLAAVATSGSYNDLYDLPTIPANTSDLNNNSDFVVSSSLATIATSGDYDDLSNKPSIPTNTSDLTNDSDFVVSADLATVATSGSYTDLTDKPTIPTNTSDLTNDSGFVTLNDFDIPTKTSDLTNDSGFITSDDLPEISVPVNTSDLVNNSGFITLNDVPTKTSDLANDSGFITIAEVPTVTLPTKVSDLANDSGFITADDLPNITVPTSTSDLTNDSGFITSSDIPTSISDLINDSNFVDIFNPAVSSGITSAKVTDYDSHIADNDIHVTTADKTSWNTVTSKANDSDVVHKSGNETIGGQKTFDSNTYIYNSDATANTPTLFLKNSKSSKGSTSETGSQLLKFIDKNNSILCDVESIVTSTGSCELRLRSNTLDSNNQNVQTGVTLISSSNGGKNFCPTSNNNVFLGASTLKWSRVYSTNYYYGNDNVEFSTKFVTTDTAQTISGAKTFSEDIVINNSDTSQSSKRLVIKSSKVNLGDNNSDSWGISFNAGSSYVAAIDSEKSYSSIQGLRFIVRTRDGDNNLISAGYRLRVYTDGSAYLSPSVTDYISLGSNSEKWKDTCTNLINGLEPSSLSLPSDRSARIDISSYITNLGNGGNNAYAVPANGYIFLRFTSVNGAICYSQTPGGLTNYAQTFVRNGGDGQLYVFFPVRKDDTCIIQIWTSSTAVVESAHFIPCQGNV